MGHLASPKKSHQNHLRSEEFLELPCSIGEARVFKKNNTKKQNKKKEENNGKRKSKKIKINK
jgi:hypothetical protein